MAKLIVTLAALWILVPAIALAGGGLDEQQVMQKTIVIENHVAPPADNNGIIIAAIIAGAFTLAGTVVAVRKKS